MVSLVAGKKDQCIKEKARWTTPQDGWLKANVDGAFDDGSGEAGVGVVIRNHKGEVQFTTWKFIEHGMGAEVVEALACKEGLMLVAEWCPQWTVIESYCSSIVSMLSRRSGE